MNKSVDVIGLLADLDRYRPEINGMLSKSLAPYLAVVTNNNDPEGLRRVRVANSANPNIESYWLLRLAEVGNDEPLPAIGETVLVLSIEGNDLNGFYVPVQNKTNPPLVKMDAVNDRYSYTRGDVNHSTDKSYEIHARDSVRVTALGETHVISGDDILIETDAAVDIRAPQLNFYVNNVQFHPYDNTVAMPTTTFNGNLEVIEATSVSINGRQVLTIDSVDSDGDISVNKGW